MKERKEKRQSSATRQLVDLMSAVLIVGIVIVAVTGEYGSLREWWTNRQEEQELRDSIRRYWTNLVASPLRLGAPHGRRVIVQFGDYQCPYCRAGHERMKDLLERDPELVMVYRHLPLTQIHPHARKAAEFASCAHALGRFSSAHAYLYTNDEWMHDPDWSMLARDSGVKQVDRLIECMETGEVAQAIERDRSAANALGISGTPSFVGPEGVHKGVITRSALNRILGIDDESANSR